MKKKITIITTSIIASAGAFAGVHTYDDGSVLGVASASKEKTTGDTVIDKTAKFGKGLLSAPGNIGSIANISSAPILSKGTQEFGLSGNLDFSDDTAYNLNLTYGHFVEDEWQVGLTASAQGVDSDVNFGIGVFTEYNFHLSNSRWKPFIGASVKWAKLDSDALDADSITSGVEFGLKYFLRENVALSFSIGAEYGFKEVFPGGDDFNKNIKIGTKFYF